MHTRIVTTVLTVLLASCGSGPGGSSGSSGSTAAGADDGPSLVELQRGEWVIDCGLYENSELSIYMSETPEVDQLVPVYYVKERLIISSEAAEVWTEVYIDDKCTTVSTIHQQVFGLLGNPLIGGAIEETVERESASGWPFVEYSVPTVLSDIAHSIRMHQVEDRLYKVEVDTAVLLSGEPLSPSDYRVNFNKYYVRATPRA